MFIKKHFFILGLILALIVRLVWIIAVSDYDYPDEYSHWAAVTYFSQYFRQPSSKEIISLNINPPHIIPLQVSYFHLAIVTAIARYFTNNDTLLLHIAQLNNSLLSLVVVLNCKFFFDRLLKDKILASYASLAVAFHPQYIFISSYPNNDIFAVWFATLTIIAVSSFILGKHFDGIEKNNFKIFTLLLTLFISFYAKPSVLVFYISVGIVFLVFTCGSYLFKLYKSRISININDNRIIKFARTLILILASLLIFLVPGLIYIKKLSVPDLSFVDVFSFNFTAEVAHYPGLPKDYLIHTVGYTQDAISFITSITNIGYWSLLLDSFWGLFGLMSIKMHNVWYLLYLLCFVFFLVGIVGTFKLWKQKTRLNLLNIIFVLTAILLITSSLSYAYKVDYQPQGRHLLPAIMIFYTLVIKGLETCFSQKIVRFLMATIVSTSIVCSSFYIPFVLFPEHYDSFLNQLIKFIHSSNKLL